MNRSVLLEVKDLSVAYAERPALHELSFMIGRREAYGLVGESGSGKSTLAMALLRYLAPGGRVTGGRVMFDDLDVLGLDGAALRDFRGRRAAMVYQNPGSALNPSMLVGEQIGEVFSAHGGSGRRQKRERVLELLGQVQLAEPTSVYSRYPHQLSGGMQQRVVIAMALAAQPDLLILDEPTTGLDATVESAILDLIADLRRELDMAVLLISHNLGVIAHVCDRVGVLYAGRLVEEGNVAEVFDTPGHPYTRGLLASLPGPWARRGSAHLQPIPGQPASAATSAAGCLFAPRCGFVRERCRESEPPLLPMLRVDSARTSRCYFWDEVVATVAANGLGTGSAMPVNPQSDSPLPPEPLLAASAVRKEFRAGGARVIALDGVDLNVPVGRTVGLVGESGSGKSTLARVIAGLEPLDSGSLTWRDSPLRPGVQQRPRSLLRQLQMVFQDPDSTLNPRHRVRTLLDRSIRRLGRENPASRQRRAVELLASVDLDEHYLDAFPSELSGGQRQRVAIARAFAGAPALVLCDEPTSALDASVQATILNLLDGLQHEQGTAYLFISHDIGVVRYLSDYVGVLYLGRLMQFGTIDAVFAAPFHPYTEVLLASVPGSGRARPGRAGENVTRSRPIRGCPFQASCPRKLGAICETEAPPWRELPGGGGLLCHIPLADLANVQAQ